MRQSAEDLTEEERMSVMVLWNGERLHDCVAVDLEEGWAEVMDLRTVDSELGEFPVHRVYGEIRLVPKPTEG